jgi:hypothetical protein
LAHSLAAVSNVVLPREQLYSTTPYHRDVLFEAKQRPDRHADFLFDAAQPSTYERLRLDHGCHIFIVRPSLACADAILPLAVKYAQHCVCCLIPFSYLSDRVRYPARDAWLRQLASEHRLFQFAPAAWTAEGTPVSDNVWLVILRSADMRMWLFSEPLFHSAVSS